MTDLILPRRRFLTGLFGLVAAPAVVKASSLMPVKAINEFTLTEHVYVPYGAEYVAPRSRAINLAQLRELLMPGLQKMVDDMYMEHPGIGKFLLAEDKR